MTTLGVGTWSVVTVAHFLLARRFVVRELQPDAGIEERLFAATVFGVATFSAALHLAILCAGLSFASGTAALAALNAAMWLLRRRPAAAQRSPPARASVPELIGAAVLLAVAMTWVDLASASSRVLGTDADSYHVPWAVNLAHGASLFGLPATPHLYPVTASTIAAWFLLPFSGPLVVDLAQLMPFLIMATSVIWLWRLLTELPGLSWGGGVVLVMFSTPMFRTISLGSADLWFAASFLATVAVAVAAWVNERSHAVDWILGGCAVGLMVGSKSTGSVAAGLLVSTYAAAVIGRRLLFRRTRPHRNGSFGAIVAASALAMGAGGIWLVRNWWLFGSPLAPSGISIAGITIFSGEVFRNSTYLSALGDWRSSGYDILGQTNRYIVRWFGFWLLPVIALVALAVIDEVIAARRLASSRLWLARAMALVLGAGIGALFLWLMIGAPWTSLEWSHGLALRHVAPLAAIGVLLGLAALFPLSWRWYDRDLPRTIALTLFGAVSLFAFLRSFAADPEASVAVPGLRALWLVAAGAVVVMHRLVKRERLRSFGIIALTLVWALTWAPVLKSRDSATKAVARDDQYKELAAFAAGAAPTSDWREIYLRIRLFEHSAGRHCPDQRFFTLARFDETWSLQNDTFSNQVFYAGRDEKAAGKAGPIAGCDYIVTSAPVASTDKGQALQRALLGGAPAIKVAETSRFIIVARGPG